MSFDELSEFYRNLAALENAGISPAQSFETFQKGERRPQRIQQYKYIAQQLKAGRPLTQSLKFLKFIPFADIPMLQAGESSGRMTDVLGVLAKKYSETSAAVKMIRSQLMQPFFTFVVAMFVPSLPALFSGKISLGMYLLRSCGGVSLVFAIASGLNEVWRQSYFSVQISQWFHDFLRSLPFFRPLSLKMAEEKFTSTLSMMLESGIDVISAILQSAQAAGSTNIQNAAQRMQSVLQRGDGLSSAFQNERIFSIELAHAIHLGSESGKLPEFLKRHANSLRNDIDARLRIFVKFFPIFIYLLVVVYVATSIISSSLASLQTLTTD